MRPLSPLLPAALLPTVLAAQTIPGARDVLAEMNLARTAPAAYAEHLKALLPHFDGDILRLPGEVGLQTTEGPAAVREAVRFLERAEPLPPMEWASGLALAAQDHVDDRGPRGALGHEGSDGSTLDDRIARYGTWLGTMSENIDYGSHTARRVVISLIVDDGVAGRGHRTNIFAPESRYAGVACGRHRTYRVMCVIDFAERPTPPTR